LARKSDRVLIERYPEINSSQNYYRILGFNNSRYKIEINTHQMRSYWWSFSLRLYSIW